MRAENAFENIVDGMHLVYGYAVLVNDENLRQFANAVICGNDATSSAEFYIKELPCVLDKLEKPKKRRNKPDHPSFLTGRPVFTERSY